MIGNRAAAYAPVADLGLVGLWDDGDDLLAEPRAPYPHTRDVLALRAAAAGAAVLLAGYARTAETQTWVDRGWLAELAEDRPAVRHTAPRVKVTADSDRALERDPNARAARLPHEVFETMRAALPQGPVLVQVPRAGYRLALVCAGCREPVRCRFCSGPTRIDEAGTRRCRCAPGAAAARSTGPARSASRGRSGRRWWARSGRPRSWAGPSRRPRCGPRSAGGPWPTSRTPPASWSPRPGPSRRPRAATPARCCWTPTTLLLRPDLRAAEEALRRWLNVVALVRSGADGGSVIAAGESAGRALQALVRTDPAGFAVRELAERAEAGFPPAVRMVRVEGRAEALAEFVDLARLPPETDVLGPVESEACVADRRAGAPAHPAGPADGRAGPGPGGAGGHGDPQRPQERRRAAGRGRPGEPGLTRPGTKLPGCVSCSPGPPRSPCPPWTPCWRPATRCRGLHPAGRAQRTGQAADRQPGGGARRGRGPGDLKPNRPRDPEFVARLAELAPDCCPVVAYGALLPQSVLDIPPQGWVNLHFSLLPAWRGAAPVQRAILAGDQVTGATTFRIVLELDAGPTFASISEPIRPDRHLRRAAGAAGRPRGRAAGADPRRHRGRHA